MENKIKTITKLFEGKEIRSVWDREKEEYYFSVVDVINVLAEPKNARDYWYQLKKRLDEEEMSEVSTKCRQLKLKAKDGKMRETDTLDTEGIFRLIESIPSKKAEPFKLWLAKLGKERVDEVFDPSKGIDKMIDFYMRKGYSLEWIEMRLKAIINRKKLTNTWKENNINEDYEFAILTNEIYKEWSGMTASEYKKYKGLRTHKPNGLNENKEIAKIGGNIAKNTRDDLENRLGRTVIEKTNSLNYQYNDEKLINN